jgi:hypothetical protein
MPCGFQFDVLGYLQLPEFVSLQLQKKSQWYYSYDVNHTGWCQICSKNWGDQRRTTSDFRQQPCELRYSAFNTRPKVPCPKIWQESCNFIERSAIVCKWQIRNIKCVPPLVWEQIEVLRGEQYRAWCCWSASAVSESLLWMQSGYAVLRFEDLNYHDELEFLENMKIESNISLNGPYYC